MALSFSSDNRYYAPDTYQWESGVGPNGVPFEAWRHKATGSYVAPEGFMNYSQQAVSNWNSPTYQAPATPQPQPQMTTPTTGGTNSAGSQPAATAAQTNVWATQPKPASSAQSGRAATFGALTGQQPQPQAVSAYDPFRDGSMASLPGQTTSLPVSTTVADRSVRDNAYPAGQTNRLAQVDAIQNFTPPVQPVQPTQPSTPVTGTPGAAPVTGNALGNYAGGRGNWQGYGPNAGGLRVDPTYLPENWNYQESPEYLWRQQQAERGANRLLLNQGRSESLGGLNVLANLRSNIAAEEVDKQYQRALNANMANYARYLGANVTNYGRTQQEEQTGWNRAWDVTGRNLQQSNYLGEQDWNRNWQLANLGLNATTTGVQSGNSTGMALANLLSQNGANQASLALQRGLISSDTIQALLNAGFTYMQIEAMIRGTATGTGTTPPTSTPTWSPTSTGTTPASTLNWDTPEGGL